MGERFATKTAQRLSMASLQRRAQKARLRGQRVRKSFKRLRAPEALARCPRALATVQQQEDRGKSGLYYFDASGFALDPTLP